MKYGAKLSQTNEIFKYSHSQLITGGVFNCNPVYYMGFNVVTETIAEDRE